MISILPSLLCLLLCVLSSQVTAWIDENHPNACQHSPWSGRLRGLEKTQIFLTNENRSEIGIPAEFVDVSHDLAQIENIIN